MSYQITSSCSSKTVMLNSYSYIIISFKKTVLYHHNAYFPYTDSLHDSSNIFYMYYLYNFAKLSNTYPHSIKLTQFFHPKIKI